MIASVIERLQYKDKFIDEKTFQWETMANVSASDVIKLKTSREAHVFIRKVSEENGIVMPFTYVGVGHLKNPRKQSITYLFDIEMEHELPEYLQYDFELLK